MSSYPNPDPTRGSGGPAGPLVQVRDLVHRWAPSDTTGETTSLDGASLSVGEGEVVALIGPSGCGKSTLLRVLAGLTVPSSGEAMVGGVSVVGRPGRCAWMPQNLALMPWRTVMANATLGAEVAGASRAEAVARARPLLERFGLGDYERAWPSQLSGGMRQRLAVLRAYLTEAPVLLLDEPFGALDAITRLSLQAWLQEMMTQDDEASNRSVLLVTHDVEEALLLADRVVVMSSRPGRIIHEVTVPMARPRAPGIVSSPDFVQLRSELLSTLNP